MVYVAFYALAFPFIITKSGTIRGAWHETPKAIRSSNSTNEWRKACSRCITEAKRHVWQVLCLKSEKRLSCVGAHVRTCTRTLWKFTWLLLKVRQFLRQWDARTLYLGNMTENCGYFVPHRVCSKKKKDGMKNNGKKRRKKNVEAPFSCFGVSVGVSSCFDTFQFHWYCGVCMYDSDWRFFFFRFFCDFLTSRFVSFLFVYFLFFFCFLDGGLWRLQFSTLLVDVNN